jgi:hypothetical protein
MPPTGPFTTRAITGQGRIRPLSIFTRCVRSLPDLSVAPVSFDADQRHGLRDELPEFGRFVCVDRKGHPRVPAPAPHLLRRLPKRAWFEAQADREEWFSLDKARPLTRVIPAAPLRGDADHRATAIMRARPAAAPRPSQPEIERPSAR